MIEKKLEDVKINIKDTGSYEKSISTGEVIYYENGVLNMMDIHKGISFKKLKSNLRSNVFRINYNNILVGKEMIKGICILTNSKVVLWDYVNMTARLEKRV